MINPAPQRQRVITFVSPKVADLLFYELVDSRLPEHRDPPTYGTAYRDTEKYPNHKLVHVTPADETGWRKYFYAADRAGQDDYNFEFSSQGTLGNAPDTLTRTYVIPRADYVPNEVAKGTADATYDWYYLESEVEQRIGDATLDSLYVVLQRTYSVRGTDETRVSPLGTDILFVERHHTDEYPGGLPEYGTPHPDTVNWPDHELVFIKKGENGSLQFFYAAKRGKQNKYNFTVREVVGASRGYDSATRTYLIKRDDYLNNSVSDDGDGGNYLTLILDYGGDPGVDPTVPAHNKFVFGNVGGAQETGPWNLTYSGREVGRTGDRELDSLYVVVTDSYIRLDTYTDHVLIPGSLRTGPVTRRLTKNPVVGGVIDDAGNIEESEQLNHDFFITTKRPVVDRSGVYGGFPRTYTTSVSYYWPAVLEPTYFNILNLLIEGRYRSIVDYQLRQPYQGPCSATVTEEWFPNPPTSVTPIDKIMRPESISYNGIWVNFGIPACLHPQVFVREQYTGTSGVLWLEKVWPATNYTDWPDTIVRQDVRPYRGGFLKITTTIAKPEI